MVDWDRLIEYMKDKGLEMKEPEEADIIRYILGKISFIFGLK
jgi:hypothetical protein